MSAAKSMKFSNVRTSNSSATPQDRPLNLDALYATQFTTATAEQQRTALPQSQDHYRIRSAAANQMNSAVFTVSENRISQSTQPVTSQDSAQKHWRADPAHICIDQFIVEDFQTSPPSPHVVLPTNDAVAGRIGAANRPQAARNAVQQEAFAEVEDSSSSAKTLIASEKSFPFVAAMEVEQFAWLPVVENLCLQQPTSFDRILSELKHEQRLGHRIVAVTSVKPGEGRTTIVQCLARRAAMQGLRVCIVDMDHQYPQLAEQLGLQIDAGWEATLTAPMSINDLAVESLRDRICLIPMKQALPDEVIVEHQGTCGKWLAELKKDFDLVLIDAAPTYEIIDRSMNDDAATAIHPLASWAIDSWLLVRNVQETSLAELARWNRRAQSLKLNIFGVLENRTATEALASR